LYLYQVLIVLCVH